MVKSSITQSSVHTNFQNQHIDSHIRSPISTQKIIIRFQAKTPLPAATERSLEGALSSVTLDRARTPGEV